MDFFSVLQQDHHLPIIGAKNDVDETNLPKVLDYLVAQILNALITQGLSLRIRYAADCDEWWI